jgi:small subunit ribosomal protein S1
MSWTRKANHAGEFVKKNQEVECQILSVDKDEKRIALGIKQLHKNPWDEIKHTIQLGQKLTSKIKDITHFGAFVVIAENIDGLIRKEDISWEEPAPDPRKALKVGEEVEFKITEINLEEQKIGCSVRHLLPNPYKNLRQMFKRGSLVDGTVTGVVDFGIFVRFHENFEGLVHISAMDREESETYKKMYKKGDKVKVVVRSIDPETRKISLSTRDVAYAVERLEIEAYIDRESDNTIETTSPFKNLKSVVNSAM